MARLPQGVRRRAGGGYEKRITINSKRYSIYGCNVKELREKEAELRTNIEQGLIMDKQKITLEKFYELWQAGREGTVKKSTQYTQDRQFKHIKASLGRMRIKDIEPSHVKVFRKGLVNKKKDNGEALLSTNGVNLIMALLSSIMSSAVREKIIMFNPCDSLERLQQKQNEEKATEGIHRALTFDETEAFFKYAEGSYYCHFFEFLLSTGMRTGEAAALLWSDIDYFSGVIHITKTVTRISDKEVEVGTPKTRSSVRDIPLTDDIMDVLEKQRRQTSILFPKRISINSRIFTATDGLSLIKTASVSTIIKYLVKHANKEGETLEPFGAHAFRDTYATRCYESGMDPLTIQKLLGHNSYLMTNKYTQVVGETMKNQASKVVTRRKAV